MRSLLLTLATVALLVASACGGTGGPADLSAREVTDADLAAMVLPQEELGAAYAGFTLDEDRSGLRSNEEAANDAFDPDDEAEDVQRFGRLNGYDQTYSLAGGTGENGPIYISMTVVLHEEADGASRNLEGGVGDAKRAVGKTSKGVTLEDSAEFSVDTVGDEAVGLFLTASLDSGQKLALYQTVVAFRRGRLLGTVGISRLDNGDVREEAVALARKLDTRS